MIKTISSIAVAMCFLAGATAQINQYQGFVYDASDSLAMIGVNISVKGTGNGTVTDENGRFILNAQVGQVLVFSSIGYQTIEKTLKQQPRDFEVYMQFGNKAIDEVVVIGYGVQKKRVATGAIESLSSEDIQGFQFQDVQSGIEGQVSGLIVSEASGQPGSAKSILIRGVGTNGDNSPLFLVDGLQVSSIDNINPEDIESIDVLKDAASTAIYGARAANGVIIITTKKGSKEGSSITYDGFYSVSQPWRQPEMLNASDYIALTREKFERGGQSSALESLGFPEAGDETPNTNWMDQIFEPATLQSHSLSISARNLFASLEYWDQNGVIGGDKSNYKRYSLRLNSDKDINKFITIGENLYINRVENNQIAENNAFGTAIVDAFAYDPITEVYDESTQYGFAQSEWVQKEYINPLSRLFIQNLDGHADQIQGNFYLDIKPTDNLRFRSDIGVDYTWSKSRQFVPDYRFHSAFVNPMNDIVQNAGYGEVFQWENYMNYNRELDKHSFDLVAGMSYREANSQWLGGSSASIPDEVKLNPDWWYLDAGEDTTDLAFGSANVEYALISYYGRLLYDFDDRYLFSFTLRRDGSSNFGSANRWGVFPSFSAGWVVTDEPFVDFGVVNFMKLRASWGVNGNDRIPALAYAATIERSFTYPVGVPQSIITGATLATPPNPDIKWEESKQFDIGMEIGLWEDQLRAEFDYYEKRTTDLLMSQIIPGYIGATNNPTSNLGEISNKGVEASITYRANIGQVRLSTTLNYTHFRNNVEEVAGDAGFIQGWNWPVRNTAITRMSEGQPVGHFVGLKTDGIFRDQSEIFSHINSQGELLQPRAKPGDLRFVDVNGDGVIDTDDFTNIGSPWPDHVLGLQASLSYKGFDISMIFSSQIGHDIYRTYERSDVSYTNYQTFWKDRWTEDNVNAELPRLVSTDPNGNQRPSDFYVEDGSFLRLKNLQMGYSLPSDLLDRFNIKGLRIYITAQNVFTVTEYRGFDPEIGTTGWILDTGIDKGFYPSNRTFGGGLKVTL
ncbi:MAG: TonB-dependent receptor [Saprospiraceae bacterium]|nr:TonB-dependent receptor [Saprospiraceae bacterium]